MDSLYNTNIIGKVLKELDKIDSTNNYLSQLLKTGNVKEGTVIYAKHQFQGRGQRGNDWYSENGKNITISIALFPKYLDIQQQFYLSKAISLGVCHFLNTITGKKVQIKWPNDLYYKDNKLGGILIENTIAGKAIEQSIVGIGINVNQLSFPTSLTNVSSIGLLTGQQYDIRALCKKLFAFLDQQYFLLQSKAFTLINQQYLQHLYRLKEYHTYNIAAESRNWYAQIVNVQDNGQLILEDVKGESRAFGFKEIVYL